MRGTPLSISNHISTCERSLYHDAITYGGSILLSQQAGYTLLNLVLVDRVYIKYKSAEMHNAFNFIDTVFFYHKPANELTDFLELSIYI